MNFIKNIGIIFLSWFILLILMTMFFFPEENQLMPDWLVGILFILSMLVPIIIKLILQYNTASKLKNRITERTANIIAAEERATFLQSQFDMKEAIDKYDTSSDKLLIFNELKELSAKITNFKIDNNRAIADYNTSISKFPLKIFAYALNLKEK